jgi:hypothetical protein
MDVVLQLLALAIVGFVGLCVLWAIGDMLNLVVPAMRTSIQNRQNEREEVRQLKHEMRMRALRRQLERE